MGSSAGCLLIVQDHYPGVDILSGKLPVRLTQQLPSFRNFGGLISSHNAVQILLRDKRHPAHLINRRDNLLRIAVYDVLDGPGVGFVNDFIHELPETTRRPRASNRRVKQRVS